MIQTLTSALWFMDGRHDKFESRAVSLPDMFQSLRGYRNYKDQHQKVPDVNIYLQAHLLILLRYVDVSYSIFYLASLLTEGVLHGRVVKGANLF